MIGSKDENGGHEAQSDANGVIVVTQVEEDDGDGGVKDGGEFDEPIPGVGEGEEGQIGG